ncbi:RNase H domain-containing protein [Ditylenchus destructor]|nr:RNase H domain-containing protein [Ditylenchus destructor]
MCFSGSIRPTEQLFLQWHGRLRRFSALNKGEKELTVRTDNDFLYGCMTRWVSGWKENGWKKRDGQEVKLKDLIQELDDLSAKLDVKYELIETLEKSDFGHDSANRLAIEGAKVAMAERGDNAKASTPKKAAKESKGAKFVAAIETVKQALANGQKEVTVRTESDRLYKSMTQWVSGWKKNGWKKTDGEEVKHKDLIQELDDLSAKLDVKYELIGSNKESKPKESGPRPRLVAAIETVKQAIANGQKEVTVRTDNDTLYKSMTKWVSGWKKNGWKRSDGEEVKNKDLIQELDDLSSKLEVKYELVEKAKKSKE